MEISKNNKAVLEINREDSMSSGLINNNNHISLVWYILSISSWALFSCCLLESYLNDPSLNNTKYYHRTISLPTVKIFITSLNLVGFIIYLIFTSCKKDNHLYKSMFRGITKFHFVPLLLTSVLLILEHSISININNETNKKNIIITDLVISLLALGTFIITYIVMHLPCEWYIVLAIKKGTFSSIIPYLLYNSIVDIMQLLIIFKKVDNIQIIDTISIILLAVISLSFSFIFKDIIIAFVNALIYVGLIINWGLNYENSIYSKGIIVLAWIIFGISEISSLTIIAILLSRFKEKIFK